MPVDDVEQFISNVKNKPAIYDKKSPSYKSLQDREKAWIEIANACCEDWDELNNLEQREKVREIQLKWRSIRCSYTKELRLLSRREQNLGGKKKRPYIYFDQLSFLRPFTDNYNLASEQSLSNEHIDSEDEESHQSSPKIPKMEYEEDDETFPDPPEPIDTIKKSDEIPIACTYNSTFEEDKHFVLSILPHFRNLSLAQKLEAKIQILKVLRKQPSFSD